MTKSQRLKPVIKASDTKERDTARALAESKRILTERQARLADLNTYREEYTARFSAWGKNGIPAIQLHEYRVFLANLNAAIVHQEKLIENSQREFEGKLRIWYQARSRSKALNSVVAKHHKEETRAETRREQSAEDERYSLIKENDRDS
ncbi:MAG: flagellar export protein FliJ [Gammaproteobacteria bacterium]